MKKLLTIVSKLCSRGLDRFVQNRFISEFPDFNVRLCCDEETLSSLFQPWPDEPSTGNKDKPGKALLQRQHVFSSRNSSSISTISVL